MKPVRAWWNIAPIAFAAVVGMNTLAADINVAFSKIGPVLDVNIP